MLAFREAALPNAVVHARGPIRVPCISGRGIDQAFRASIPKGKESENNKQIELHDSHEISVLVVDLSITHTYVIKNAPSMPTRHR